MRDPNATLGEEHNYFVTVLRDLFPRPRGRSDRRQAPRRPMSEGPAEVVAESPQERRAAAVSALLMAQIAERGGTNLDRDALLSMADKSMRSFPQADLPAVFDEMVAVLDWLADNLRRKDTSRGRDAGFAPSDEGDGRVRGRSRSRGRGRGRGRRRGGEAEEGGEAAPQPDVLEDVDFDPAPVITALNTAIELGEDVVIDYFSFHRKAWSERRVTPQTILGDFLKGHCHLRETERRFRLTRIRKIVPAPPVEESE